MLVNGPRLFIMARKLQGRSAATRPKWGLTGVMSSGGPLPGCEEWQAGAALVMRGNHNIPTIS